MKQEDVFENSRKFNIGEKIQPFTENLEKWQFQRKSFFKAKISYLNRKKMLTSLNKLNGESYPSDAERKNKMREEIHLALKEIMYNSVAQAIIKIFSTPHLVLKLSLTLFVLLTISIR